MSDSPRVEHIRPDIGDLAQKAAQSMLEREGQQARQAAVDGPKEARRESWGIIARKTATGEWRGEIQGTLPGAHGETVVWWAPRPKFPEARWDRGLIAEAKKKYLHILTSSCVCSVEAARVRAADAEFFIAMVL